MSVSRADIALLERVRLPAGFSWGVGTSGYQIEGGINVTGGPRNNWAVWEDSGRIRPTGVANRFWEDPAPMLALTRAFGGDCFRFGTEWSRLQPEPDAFSSTALDHYAALLAAAHAQGLAPLVNASHFTHPEWMGHEPWVDEPDRTIERFRRYTETLARELGRRLVARGLPPVARWVTLNEINLLPLGTYVLGVCAPGRLGQVDRCARMRDALFAAHVVAYDALHDIYAGEGWPAPAVTTNNSAVGVYEWDLLLIDVLTARQRGVALDHLDADLARRHRQFDASLSTVPRTHPTLAGRLVLQLMERMLAPRYGTHSLPRTLAALAASRRDRKLDFLAADYYYPLIEDQLRCPGRRGPAGTRLWTPDARLFEHTPNPAGLLWYLRQLGCYGMPVLLLESGMCTFNHQPRRDGWERSRFLRENLLAVLRALDEGIDIIGYHHWSIADNYEWGTYALRFGLHTVERDGDRIHILDTDALGQSPARTFGEIIAALQGGGTSERVAAFGVSGQPAE